MQTSMREWALRQGWGGRPVRQESAQGILVAALGVLVKHYGSATQNAGLHERNRHFGTSASTASPVQGRTVYRGCP
jgi:hypothetical protein